MAIGLMIACDLVLLSYMIMSKAYQFRIIQMQPISIIVNIFLFGSIIGMIVVPKKKNLFILLFIICFTIILIFDFILNP